VTAVSELLAEALSDRYSLERELARGGMATVYLAHRVHDRGPVAIKVMHPALAADLGAKRFLREVEIAASMTHPLIVPLHESGAADGVLYYVMPYVEGESLHDRLQREKRIPLEDALQITPRRRGPRICLRGLHATKPRTPPAAGRAGRGSAGAGHRRCGLEADQTGVIGHHLP
jgi:hypothetical protein